MEAPNWVTDDHKKAMNYIYQKPLYPEVWNEEDVKRGADRGHGSISREAVSPTGSTPVPAAKPKLFIPKEEDLEQGTLF